MQQHTPFSELDTALDTLDQLEIEAWQRAHAFLQSLRPATDVDLEIDLIVAASHARLALALIGRNKRTLAEYHAAWAGAR